MYFFVSGFPLSINNREIHPYYVLVVCSFSLLSGLPLHECISLFIHSPTDGHLATINKAASREYSCIRLICEHIFSLLLDKDLDVELLGQRVDTHSVSEETSKEFSKVVASFYTLVSIRCAFWPPDP